MVCARASAFTRANGGGIVSMLDAALAYAARGLQVFALAPRAKLPATEHGCKDATCNADAVRAMWTDSACNVGIAMGVDSGVFALDIDGEAGSLTYRTWQAMHGAMPTTPVVLTSRGMHVYLRHPGEQVAIRNSAGTVGDGIDVRTDGGYLVAPPSVHPSGSAYAWAEGTSPASVPFADAPDWLIRKLLERPKPAPHASPAVAYGGHTRYGQRALDEECMELQRAQEGQRNHALNALAFRVGQLVAAGHLQESSALSDVRRSAASCGLDERETRATLASGFNAGLASPKLTDPRPEQYAPRSTPPAQSQPATQLAHDENSHGVMTAHQAAKSALMYATDSTRAQMARTGFTRLDEALGGMPPGTMHTVGGRTGSGKSSLLLAIALRQSRAGLRVGIVSCEDAEWIWGARVIASLRDVNPKKFFKVPVDDAVIGLALLGVEEARSYGVHFAFTIGRPVKHVLEAVSRLVKREQCNVIMVDYLQAILAKGQERYTARTDAAQEIKGLCHQLGVPLVISSQLKRPENGNPFRPPTSNDLKDSGDIENMSDSIVLMWQANDDEHAPTLGKVSKVKWSDDRPRFRLERNPVTGAVVNLVEPPVDAQQGKSRGGFIPDERGWHVND